MAKDFKLAMLLDFYGGLLTDKQAQAMDMYYNQDMSLAEIAEEMEISRQGVMAFLKQGEKHLRSFEDKLGLAGRFDSINCRMSSIQKIISAMPDTEESKQLLELVSEVSEYL